ncbi:hypothetical protein A6770_19405 [Nostoc minutum NIES-26]|uniref:Uncharacterized protein n=1 Tax=Nostoc minutum NIES-26 TaxID=1844469 RepID=A0A367R8K1_9NOSO|nr:hypothetical protein A6770_19405 [Nostoc minutum NIES-26]
MILEAVFSFHISLLFTLPKKSRSPSLANSLLRFWRSAISDRKTNYLKGQLAIALLDFWICKATLLAQSKIQNGIMIRQKVQ